MVNYVFASTIAQNQNHRFQGSENSRVQGSNPASRIQLKHELWPSECEHMLAAVGHFKFEFPSATRLSSPKVLLQGQGL